jgi:hypothetical protein
LLQPSQAHLAASAPLRARHPPVSGRLSRPPPRRRDGTLVLVSRCLSAAGLRFSAILSRQGFRPSYDRPTGIKYRTLTGFPRSAHTRYGRIGRPLYSGTSGAHTSQVVSPARRLPPSCGTGPAPRPCRHLSGAESSRSINQGFTHVRPPGLPLTCGPRMTRAPSGFTPGFAPTRARPAHARQGGDRLRAQAWSNATGTYVMPDLQSACSLAHVRLRVAPPPDRHPPLGLNPSPEPRRHHDRVEQGQDPTPVS